MSVRLVGQVAHASLPLHEQAVSSSRPLEWPPGLRIPLDPVCPSA